MKKKSAPDILEMLAERRNKLAETETSTYINQQEINSIYYLEQEIERGREAELRGAEYFEFMKTNEWSWRGFADFWPERKS